MHMLYPSSYIPRRFEVDFNNNCAYRLMPFWISDPRVYPLVIVLTGWYPYLGVQKIRQHGGGDLNLHKSVIKKSPKVLMLVYEEENTSI
jgi:hypothetical protein